MKRTNIWIFAFIISLLTNLALMGTVQELSVLRNSPESLEMSKESLRMSQDRLEMSKESLRMSQEDLQRRKAANDKLRAFIRQAELASATSGKMTTHGGTLTSIVRGETKPQSE